MPAQPTTALSDLITETGEMFQNAGEKFWGWEWGNILDFIMTYVSGQNYFHTNLR
jgi:hypothetical protein